jgi:hypothetical protein
VNCPRSKPQRTASPPAKEAAVGEQSRADITVCNKWPPSAIWPGDKQRQRAPTTRRQRIPRRESPPNRSRTSRVQAGLQLLTYCETVALINPAQSLPPQRHQNPTVDPQVNMIAMSSKTKDERCAKDQSHRQPPQPRPGPEPQILPHANAHAGPTKPRRRHAGHHRRAQLTPQNLASP